VESDSTRCILCSKITIDEVRLGPMYHLDDVVCHYFCMLFSSGLPQNGSDNDGILGFLPRDIKKEARRVSVSGRGKLKCKFCKGRNAFVGCSVQKCRGIWHFPCGVENGINHQFFGKYEAFCKQHCNLPRKILHHPRRNLQGRRCPICFSSFEAGDDFPVFGSCCISSVFHRRCVQKYALNSGSLFKCPTCSERSFQRDAQWQGVFVPERDASWEQEPNAFRGLSRRRLRCDFDSCQCPQGRNFRDVDVEGKWYIVRCVLCGGPSTHVQCSQVKDIASWACGTCKSVAVTFPMHHDGDSSSSDDEESSSDSSDLFEPCIVVRKRNVAVRGGNTKS